MKGLARGEEREEREGEHWNPSTGVYRKGWEKTKCLKNGSERSFNEWGNRRDSSRDEGRQFKIIGKKSGGTNERRINVYV